MTCDQARELLLEADRADLLGESDTALGRHVAACETCRALGRRLVDAERALDGALERLSRGTRAAGIRWTRLAPWGGLAAAAALVLLLLPKQPPPAGPREAVHVAAALDVDVSRAAGQTAVVLQTADPGITVVWFFKD